MRISDLNWQEPKLELYNWQLGSENFPFWVQRDDLIHPVVSGNKSRKLRGWIEHYFREKYNGIITFGGAFSNHLIATASVCKELGIPSLGLVRGDEGFNNPYLNYCEQMGMQLRFVSRTEYRNKESLSEAYRDFGNRNNLIIPEGGKGQLGLIGFKDLVDSWNGEFPDIIVHASATATTSAGLALALQDYKAQTKVISVLVLRNLPEQESALLEWGLEGKVEFISDFHFGGYAKVTDELETFIQAVNKTIDFPLEPIYTGKAFYALINRVLPKNKGKKVCFLHTGGTFLND